MKSNVKFNLSMKQLCQLCFNISLLIILTTNLLVFNTFAQNSYIKNRWNFKVAYSNIKTGAIVYNNNKKKYDTKGFYSFEINYGISNNIELGGYLGYSRFDLFYSSSQTQIPESYIVKYSNSPFYGFNLNYHLLPFLIKHDDFRFDMYIAGKFGGHYMFSPDNYYPSKGNIFDYKIGCGISFYLWKHFGFFTEIGLANFSNFSYSTFTYFSKKTLINANYGLTFKF